MVRTVCLSIACLLFAGLAGAQSAAPFTAQTRRVYYDIADSGAKSVRAIFVGTFNRASDGTTALQQHPLVGGDPGEVTVVLTKPDGEETRISFKRKEAILLRQGGTNYQPPFANIRGAHREINGVDCIVIPAKARVCDQAGCAPQPDPRDFACVSPTYGTVVHSDVLETVSGRRREIVYDVSQFASREPDPAIMRVPAGFRIRTELIPSPPRP